jgi:hypothetical protein
MVGPIGPQGSVERPVRCIFCGAISAWWACGCEYAQRIRDEKLPRPRTVIRGGVAVIELCEELRRAARLAGVITGEYRKTEPRIELQTEPSEETEPPEASETGPLGAREGKRARILAQILGNPDLSDRAIAAELGVSRNTVAAVRAMMRHGE